MKTVLHTVNMCGTVVFCMTNEWETRFILVHKPTLILKLKIHVDSKQDQNVKKIYFLNVFYFGAKH